MAGFKIPIVADTSQFIAESGKLENALDQIADSLDQVADKGPDLEKDFEQALTSVEVNAKKAGKALAYDVPDGSKKVSKSLDGLADDAKDLDRRFSESWKSVSKDAAKAGRDIGDDVKKGTDKAAEGMTDFKDEAQQSAREGAASFSGEFDDVADYVQEVLANALSGFGPVGAAAGIAAAAGIGFLVTSLQNSADQADATKQSVIDLAGELKDVRGNPDALDWASRLSDMLSEVVDKKSWWEIWQNTPKTRLEEWSKAADQLGISLKDGLAGVSGDQDAWNRFLDQVKQKTADANRATQQMIDDGIDPAVAAMTNGAPQIQDFADQLEAQKQVADDASGYYNLMQDALSGVSDAQKVAADALTEYEGQVSSALDNAGSSWDQYTTDGVVNLEAYNAAIEAQQQAITNFEANLSASAGKLSADALAYIESLGPDAAPLLQAFADAPLDQQQRTAANWDTIGKASTQGYQSSLKIDQATTDAVSKAQSAASARPIMVTTKLSEQLAYDVQRAISNVGEPTIRVHIQADRTVF